jgi:hypothetical protein
LPGICGEQGERWLSECSKAAFVEGTFAQGESDVSLVSHFSMNSPLSIANALARMSKMGSLGSPTDKVVSSCHVAIFANWLHHSMHCKLIDKVCCGVLDDPEAGMGPRLRKLPCLTARQKLMKS